MSKHDGLAEDIAITVWKVSRVMILWLISTAAIATLFWAVSLVTGGPLALMLEVVLGVWGLCVWVGTAWRQEARKHRAQVQSEWDDQDATMTRYHANLYRDQPDKFAAWQADYDRRRAERDASVR